MQLLFAASGELILTLIASQPVGGREDITSLEVQSYIRGYHTHQDIWDPRIREVLLLQREPNNPEDKFAVAIIRRGNIVGHLPFNLASVVSAFLRRDVNKGLVEVKDTKVNQGAGYGLEIPCTYFYGSKSFIDKLNQLVEDLREEGRLKK